MTSQQTRYVNGAMDEVVQMCLAAVGDCIKSRLAIFYSGDVVY